MKNAVVWSLLSGTVVFAAAMFLVPLIANWLKGEKPPGEEYYIWSTDFVPFLVQGPLLLSIVAAVIVFFWRYFTRK